MSHDSSAAKKVFLQRPEGANEVLQAIGHLVSQKTGVQFSERHLSMISSRLTKRLQELNLKDFHEYQKYLTQNLEAETHNLVSLLTTHHTFFFREFSHFEYLAQNLSRFVAEAQARPDKVVRVLSAACSRGQEAYSLAMWLDYQREQQGLKFDFQITATDVDRESINFAKNGVYPWDEVKEIPMHLLAKNWARGTGEIAHFAKIKNTVKSNVTFDVLNLIEPNWALKDKFDVIFCRNVFIYFTRVQIAAISNQLLKFIQPQGIFFVGLSESLHGLELKIKSVGPSTYILDAPSPQAAPQGKARVFSQGGNVSPIQAAKPTTTSAKPVTAPPIAPTQAKLTRVLCIDDSPSILTLLKQILSAEQGFEIIGTAKNGREGREQISKLSPDIVTLDIHMPEETGLEALKNLSGKTHPPIVIVSSVSREDSDLAMQAIELGAADYIEKPQLTTLLERGEEIRVKLRCALQAVKAATMTSKSSLDLERQFKKVLAIPQPELRQRIVILPLSRRETLSPLFAQWKGVQPATLILVEGASQALPAIAKDLSQRLKKQVQLLTEQTKMSPQGIYLAGTETLGQVRDAGQGKKTSMIVIGETSAHLDQVVLHWPGLHLLVEEIPGGKTTALAEVAAEISPVTSHAYLSSEYLSK